MRLAAGLLALVALPAIALAQPGMTPPSPPPPSTPLPSAPLAPEHDHRGLFVRGFVGVGGIGMKAGSTRGPIKVAGAGGAIGLEAGYGLTPQWVVFGELSAATANQLQVEVDGSTVETDNAVGLSSVGVGAAYFLIPANVSFSATLSINRMRSIEGDQTRYETDGGGGLSAMVAKEWWVGREWALGAALRVFAADLDTPDDPSYERWKVNGLALLFTATYN